MSTMLRDLQEAELREREQRVALAREEAMRAMAQALVVTEAAKKSRDEFLSRMSHELRTPLNAVIGFSKVLEHNRAGNQRPEDIEMLSRVRAGGEQLLRLVEDVLDQSTIEQGRLTVDMTETNVSEIVSRVVATYRTRARAKGLRLFALVADPGPPVRLDAGRFEQVLGHLLDNAVKFTGIGAIRVTVATDAATKRPTRVIVADSGIGIPANRLEYIFEPFQQVETSMRRSFEGAGLGLPLARQLCEAMGCRLTVESNVGQGSRFTIRLPGA